MTAAVQISPLVLLSRPVQPARHPLRILHLEDSESDGAVVRLYLERQGFGGHIVCVHTRLDFLDQLACDFDVVLADHSMPGFDSFEALRLVQERCPQVPFIVVSGTITEEAAVYSVKSGAADYIWKDRLQRLGPAIKNALRERRHRTEHETALRARRESEALSHAVLASLSQLICVLAPDGVIVNTNASWKTAGAERGTDGLTGLDVGTNYLDVCRRSGYRGDHLALAALVGIKAVLAGEQDEFSMEYPCHAPTGRAWYTLTVTPLGDGLGAVLSHQSITELRGSQEQLAQNQSRLKAIFEGSLDAILLADDDGRYVDANPAAAALLGYTSEELVGLSVRDIAVPEQQDGAAEGWAAFRAAGRASGEFTVMRKDGAFVPTEFSATADVLPGLHLSILRDITERRAAEASLAEASRQNAEILESIGDGFFSLDADWRFTYVNGAAERFLSRSREDLLGQHILDVLPEFEGTIFESEFERARRGDMTVRFTALEPTGGRWNDVRVFPFSGGVTAYFHDVTEEKRAEDTLRESEAQFVQIADAMPQIVWTTDPDGYNDYFNERWYDYSGMARPAQPDDPIALFEWGTYVHPDDIEELSARWTHSLATGEPYEHEHRFRRAADGEYRWFVGRAVPVRDKTGAVARWFGTCTDIHDIHDAREELRRSGERLRLVSHATNDAVWDWDVRTGAAVMNKAFTEVFGWRATADGGFTIEWMLERVHPDERDRVTASAFGAFKGSEPGWRAEYRFERADGTWADVVTQGHIVRSPDGWAVRVVGTMLDLTARKATERALVEAKEAAEEIARAKSSLLMNMSHEIRTPLTAILGYAELLGDECGPEQTAQREYAAIIENGGRRLLDTLNSVLDFAQIEANALPLATVTVDLRAESEAAIAALQPLAQADGLVLALTGPPTAVRADRPALARVLTNLIGNAIKFTDHGTVAVDVWAEGGSAWLRVTDTGVGIDPEFLPYVFDDFKQESSGTGRLFEGSGLGLTITRGLVTKMGGEISVASEKGVGSTFTVRLPAP